MEGGGCNDTMVEKSGSIAITTTVVSILLRHDGWIYGSRGVTTIFGGKIQWCRLSQWGIVTEICDGG